MDGSRRNGNKRHSSSHDTGHSRHGSTSGHLAAESGTDLAMRAVTPEPPNDGAGDPRSPAILPTSPAGAARARPDTNDRRQRAPSRPLIPTDNGTGEATPRPRTRTLEQQARSTSPAAPSSARRPRVSSSANTGKASDHESDELSSSIGYPSIVSLTSTPGMSRTERLMRSPPPRPLSPATSQHGVPTFPVDLGDSLPSPTSDTSRIFSLMKTTCGRMHGILYFRTQSTGPWMSGYCAINVASGSLIFQESKGSITQTKTLIPDLRGSQVRTQGTHTSQTGYIEVLNRNSGARVHLRPRVPETFASWLAALLCWQPLRPKGSSTGPARPPRSAAPDPRPVHQRRNSSFNLKDAATIKLGQMLYWDHDARVLTPQSPRRISTYKQQRSASGTPWRRVSATLQSNGLLKLYLERDNSRLALVPIASLCRSAIQRLHPSVVEDEYCIGIYPQYSALTHTPLDLRRPVFLSLETRVLFESWFALFKAFAIPELYGPESSAITSPAQYVDGGVEPPTVNTENMFRLERTLVMRVTEAKLPLSPEGTPLPIAGSRSTPADPVAGDYHAEVFIDGEIRGRTAVKNNTRNPFWRQDYEFGGLPPTLRTASVIIKSRNTGQRDWTLVSDERYNKGEQDIHNLNHMDIVGEIQISPLDNTIGTVTVNLDDLERCRDIDDWFPVFDERGEKVGELLLKVRLDESIVLMSQEYKPLLQLLQHFSNGLTQQIVSTFPASELRQLPETLLNIFEVLGNATDWLSSLVEDEIDAVDKKPPAIARFRFSRRIASDDSYVSGVEREMFLRDMNRNANVEANLLFRGNSLLTKALDAHMKRVGKEYLEEVLGDHMRDIDESDPDCEVDPLRVNDQKTVEKHWYNLITLTEHVWNSIAASVEQCPPELRAIFRRIRSCAEDRYGDFQRNVGYSSISGFLFLRFLCAAVLNPKLFGLLKDHPRPRAQRTLTLMAKSLQALANMTTFGGKEPWMEPMNGFLNSRRQEFKDFVDDICSIAADRDPTPIPPSFATPNQIRNRLPTTSREGFPSLPYLLDVSSECAALVSIWIDATSEASEHPPSAAAAVPKRELAEEERHLVEFDALCHELRGKTRDVLGRAEQLDRPSGVLEVKWEELVAQMDRKSHRPAQRPLRPLRPQRLSSDPSLASLRQRSSPLSAGGLGAVGANDSVTSLDHALGEPGMMSPLPLPPASAPPSRTRAPPPLPQPQRPPDGDATGRSSPGPESATPGSDSLWSSGTEDDRFPTHALSWDDADDASGADLGPPPASTATDPLAPPPATRPTRSHREQLRHTFASRSRSRGSQRSTADDIQEESALSPGLVSSMGMGSGSGSGSAVLQPPRDRELSNGGGGEKRRLMDGWGFRRKVGAGMGVGMAGSPGGSVASPVREERREREREKERDKEREKGRAKSADRTETGSGSGGGGGKKKGRKLQKE